MRGLIVMVLLFFFSFLNKLESQVGIGTKTPHSSSVLDLTSSNKGFLPSRIALTGRNDMATIASPASGLLIYNTATAGTSPNSVSPGYYYFNGTSWVSIATSTPDATIEFSVKSNPNTAGTTFSPNTPQSKDYIYVSTIDGSQWTWNGTAYILYIGANTPFYLTNTTSDAGNNKTSAIYRNGNLGLGISVPTQRLHVVGTTNNAYDGILLQPNNTSQSLNIGYSGVNSTFPFSIAKSSATIGTFDATGLTMSKGWVSTTHPGTGNEWDNGLRLTNGIHDWRIYPQFSTMGLRITGAGGATAVWEFQFTNTSFANRFMSPSNTDQKIVVINGITAQTQNLQEWQINGTAKSIVSSDGSIGVGTTSATEKVTINGAVKISNGGYTGITNGATTPVPNGGSGTIVFSGSNFFGWNGTSWKQLDN